MRARVSGIMSAMKRIVYIAAFVLLGLLLSTLLHAAIEMPTLWLITGNIEKYGQSWVWQNWQLVHGVGSAILWLLGATLGFLLGRRYWHILYIEKRFGEKRF